MNPDILKRLEQADQAAKAAKAAPAIAVPPAPTEPPEFRPVEPKAQKPKAPKPAATKVAAPAPTTKVTRAGVELSDEDLAGILLGAPPKAEPAVDPKLQADLQADLDLKKFYEKARTSVDSADAVRSLGKSFPEYERQAVAQGVSLDDMVKQAQKGVGFDDYAKVAGNQIAFLPPQEREAKFAEQERKYREAERGEINLEEMKLAPAEESGIFKGYEVGGTKPEELPEAAKPGEAAYMTAERLIQTLSQRPDWVARFDGYRNRAGGRYSAEWVNDAEKKLLNKIDSADPEYEKKVADARRQAFVEMVAAKTIGFWAPPIFVKKEELEKGEVPGFLSSMAPGNVEVVGFNKDGKILYRSESPMGYALRALDFASVVPLPFISKNAAVPIPGQSAVVGMVTKGENETLPEAAARGMKTSANWADYAMEESEGAGPFVRGVSMGLGLAGAMTHPDAFTGAAVGYTKAKGALSGYRGRRFAKAADPLLTDAAKALQAEDYDAVRENLAKFRTLSQEYSPGGKTNYSDLLARADASFIEAITLADPSVKSLDPRLSEKLLTVLGDAPEVRSLIGRLAVVGDPHLHFSRSSREAATSLGKKATEATEGAGATFETYLNAGNYGRRRELLEQAKRLYELNAPKTTAEAATRAVDGKILALEVGADARVKMDVPNAARDAAFDLEMARILRKHRDGLVAGDAATTRAIDEDMVNSPVIGRGVTGDEGKAAEQFRLEHHSVVMPGLRGRVSSILKSDIAKSHQEALQLFDQALSSAKANEASLGMAIEYMRRQLGRQTGVTITPRDVQYDALPFAEKVGELSPPAYATFAQYRAKYPNVDPMNAWAEIRLVDQAYLAKAEREGKSIYDIWSDSNFEFAPVKGAPKKGGKPPATPTTVAPPGTTAATTVAAAAASGGGKVVHPMVLDVASAIKADSGLDIPADRVDAVLKAVDKLGPGEQLKRPPFVSNAQFGAVAQELVRRELLTTADGKVFTKPEALVPTEAATAAKAEAPTAAAPAPAPAPAEATPAAAAPAPAPALAAPTETREAVFQRTLEQARAERDADIARRKAAFEARLQQAKAERDADLARRKAEFQQTLETPKAAPAAPAAVVPEVAPARRKVAGPSLADLEAQAEASRRAREGLKAEAPKAEAPAPVVEAPKAEPVVEVPVFERTVEEVAEAPAEPAFQRAAEPEAAVPVAAEEAAAAPKRKRRTRAEMQAARDAYEAGLRAAREEDSRAFLEAADRAEAQRAAARAAEEAPAAAPEVAKAEEVAAPVQPTGITPAAEAPVVREEIPASHTEALDRIRGLTHQVEVPTFTKPDPNVPERIRLGSARVFGTLDAEGRFVPQASVRWLEGAAPPTLETVTRELYREAGAADAARSEARILIDAAGDVPEPRPFKGEMYAERADKLEDRFGSSTTFRSIYKSLATPPSTPAAVAAKVSAPRAMTAQRLNGALVDLYYGRISPRQFVAEAEQVADKAAEAFVARRINRQTSQLVRGADMARERLINARRRRILPDQTVDFALWLLDKNPFLADDLSVLVKETKTSAGGAAVAGEYKPLDRVVQLFSAPDLPSNTVVHEILHHTETMMPLAIQKGITREWAKSVMLAMADAATPDERRLLGLMFMQDPKYTDEIFRGFESGVLSPSKHYQLVNPSEFWAVNAADILAGRRAAEAARGVSGWVVKAKQWLSEFVQKARATFNLTSQAPIIRGLDEVLRGFGTPVNDMLTKRDVFYAVKSGDEATAAAKAEAEAKVAVDAATPPPMLSRDAILDEVRAAEAARKQALDVGAGESVIAKAEADLAAARAKLVDLDRELDESAEAAASMEAAIDETRAAAEAGRPVPGVPAAAEMRRVILVSEEPGSIIRAAVRYLTDEALNAEDVLELARIARSRGVNVSAEYGRFVGSEEDVAKAYEVVADAFVDYLKTSKSPPTSQGALFDYMRDVFSRTYKSTLAGPGGDAVSPRVRAAFDRLLPATPLKPKGVFEDAFTQLTTKDPVSRGALRVLSDEAVRRGIGTATVEKLQEILTAKLAEARKQKLSTWNERRVLSGDTTLIEFPAPVLGRESWTVNDLAALQERIDTDARALARANDLQFDVLGRPVETSITEKLYSYVGGLAKTDDSAAKTVGKSVIATNVYAFLGGSVVNTAEGMRALSPELRRDMETLARHTLNVVGDAGALLTEAVDSGDMRPFIGYLSGESLEFTGVTERGAGRRVLTSGTEYTTGFLNLFRNVWDSLDDKERAILTRMTVALNSKFKEFDPKLLEKLRDLRGRYDASKVTGLALSKGELTELKSLEAQYADHMINFRQPSEAIVAMMFPESTPYLTKKVVDKFRREQQELLDGALNKVLGVKSGDAETVASSLGTAIGDILGRGGQRSINDFRMVESLLYVAGKTERNGALFGGTVFESTETLLRDTARIVGGTGRTAQAGDEAARRLGVLVAGFGSAVFGKLELVGLRATLTEAEFRAFSAWSLGREISPEMRGQLARVAERFGLNTDFVQETMLGTDVYIPSAARKMILDAVARSVYRDLTTVGLAGEAMRAALIATKKRMTRGNLVLRPRYFNVNTVDHFFQMNLIAGARVGAASAARLAFQTLMTTRVGNLLALLIDRPANAVLRTTKRVLRAEGVNAVVSGAAGVAEMLPVTLPIAERLRDALSFSSDYVAQLMSLSKYRIEVNKVLDGRDEVFIVGERAYNARRVREIFSGEGVFSAWDTRRIGSAIRREGVMSVNEAGQLVRISYAKGGEVSTGAGAAVLGLTHAVDDFLLGGARNAVDDLADAWAERERVGAAVTLMEAGMDPRVAARVVIDALYDYGQSMTDVDRSFLVQVLFPFWAFQKNANGQFINSLFSPRTAYRMQMWLKFRYRATDMITQLMYNNTGGELGIDVESMPVEAQQLYYAVMTKAHEQYGPVLPANIALGLRMILTGDPTDVARGQEFQIDADLASGLGEILGPQTRSAQMLFARYRVTPPSKAGLPSFLRDRPGIGVTRRRSAYTALYLSMAGDDEAFTWYALPESSVESSYKFAAHQMFVQLSLVEAGMALVKKDIPMSPEVALNLIRPIVDVERSPVVGSSISLYSGQGYPQRLHPMVASQLESMGFDLIRVPAANDPFADGTLLTSIEDAQVEATAKKEGFDPTQLLGEDRLRKIRELNNSDLQPSELAGVRYYLPPGTPSLVFENSGVLSHGVFNLVGAAAGAALSEDAAGGALTLGAAGQLYEINRLLLDADMRPDEREDIYGKLRYVARFYSGADIYMVSPDKTAAREEPMFTKKTPQPQ